MQYEPESRGAKRIGGLDTQDVHIPNKNEDNDDRGNEEVNQHAAESGDSRTK